MGGKAKAEKKAEDARAKEVQAEEEVSKAIASGDAKATELAKEQLEKATKDTKDAEDKKASAKKIAELQRRLRSKLLLLRRQPLRLLALELLVQSQSMFISTG